jgi:mannose-6-phosphate isomerase-like protein (cupin superfamily)
MLAHLRSLPNHWALLCGRAPPDELGFQTDKLQIIFNNTDQVWTDDCAHAHAESDEVYIVLEGGMTIDVEGKHCDVMAGDFLCIPAGVFHQLIAVSTPTKSFVIRSASIDDKILKPI